jgi:glycosyltransferase involved in cell wall biosynthesis
MYNGCDVNRLAPSADRLQVRRELGIEFPGKLMLFCGSVARRKGIACLARAWRKFSAGHEDWRLAVVGRLVDKELVRELRSLPSTRVIGPVPQDGVRTWMQASDGYVQPSLCEGLSNATMEAMATGLPVIATNVGGQGEFDCTRRKRVSPAPGG